MIFLFDLDHTVIDSSHRQLTKPDGSLDLEHWRENCTAEKIAKDKPLPLARVWKRILRQPNHKIVVCTSRVMQAPDWIWLAENGLKFHHALYRATDDSRGDAEYKYAKIAAFMLSQKIARKRWGVSGIVIDDNQSVLDMVRNQLKMPAVDAIKENEKVIKSW